MRASRPLIALFLGVTSTCFAQSPTWTKKCVANGPQAAYYPAMAYDAAHGQVVLFGGAFSDFSLSNDTWTWDGFTWTKQSPVTRPPARTAHAMAYDAARGQVVMFGGASAGSFLNDTWVWDGFNWTPKAAGPGARLLMGMAYDAARQQVVLFGGSVGTPTPLGDTWVWDGSSWTPKSLSAPLGLRSNYRLAYDEAHSQVVLFGGWNGSSLVDEMWVWDGATWTPKIPVTGPPPPARQDYAIAYDANLQRVVLFSGIRPPSAPVDDITWLWDGTNWTDASPAASPSARGGAAAAYDSAHGQFALFGGVDSSQFFTETWVFGAPASTSCPPPILSFAAPSNGVLRGEPVNTATGNYYYQHTDLMIPGRGMPLVFQRNYNALDTYSGPLGANWTHSYNVAMTTTTTSAIIKWGDGHGETFTLSGGTYVPQPGVFSTLIKNADGTFVLTRKDQSRFNFSLSGKLTSIQDKNGNTVTLIYNGNGNLTQITDTVGRNLTLSYDGSNRVTRITDPISRVVSFQYDVNNNLVQTTDPAGGITTFAYDTSHRVTSITQPNGQTLITNVYDASGRVTTQTGGRGFSGTFAYDTPNTGETTFTDARGNQTIDKYDSSLRIVKITEATGGMTSFTYDASNDRTSATNQNGKTTNFAYDSLGNVTGIIDPLGNAIAFTYDARSDLLTAANAKGKTTTFTYGVTGNLTAIKDALTNTTAFGYDGFGELISKTDGRGNSTAYLYDSLGNLTRITDALSHSTALNYDAIGRLTSITDPNGHAAGAIYDALSRLVKITDPLSNQTQFAYDSVGNLLKITDAKGNATSYAYDATNNLVSVTDALGRTTRYAYDANNNRIAFSNAKSNVTSYVFDPLNRLIRTTDPLSSANSYSYDPIGNVLAVTDAKGQTNQFTYDALNRLLSIAYADGKNVAYSYDANGNRVSMVDFHGTTAYAYDDLDRLTLLTNPGAKVVTYAYDAVGNRKSLMYPDGKAVSYSFDPANRLSAATDWLGRNTAYSYDAAGNLIRTSYPNGTSIAFGYDAANRLAQVINALKGLPALTLAYTLDAVGNRVALSVDGVKTNFSYDALNELVSAQLGPLKSIWTYDAVGNCSKQTSPLGAITYTYDAGDRLLAAGTATFTYDANGNQTSVAKTSSSQPLIYQYDAANRLVAATGGRPTSSFAYDGDGNRISQSVGAGIYNYLNDVATALPVVLQESGPDGNISYAYGLGLISESSLKFDYFYHYDGLGSVIALSDASGKPSAAYVYDPWGNPLLNVSDSVGTKNKFRFTGEALDPGTQLYYLRARYYDSTIARFVSRDPLPGIATLPSSENRYRYALSDPLRFTDPSGLAAIQKPNQWLTLSTDALSALASMGTGPSGFTTIPVSISSGGNPCDAIDCISAIPLAISTANYIGQFTLAPVGALTGGVVSIWRDANNTNVSAQFTVNKMLFDIDITLAGALYPPFGIAVGAFKTIFPQQYNAVVNSFVERSLYDPIPVITAPFAFPVSTPTLIP